MLTYWILNSHTQSFQSNVQLTPSFGMHQGIVWHVRAHNLTRAWGSGARSKFLLSLSKQAIDRL